MIKTHRQLFIIIFLLAISTGKSFGWYLNPNTGRGFDNSKINLYISESSCDLAGFSLSEYKSMLESAVKQYWNSVPTSSLNIQVKDVIAINIDGETHASAINLVPSQSILAGCNASANEFDNPAILGSAVMGCAGSDCRAILILNAHPNSTLSTRSRSYLEAVIAHEIGHAIGLGHSQFEHNLMYYNISGKYQKRLGLDDINGVSYLYPKDPGYAPLSLPVVPNCSSTNFKQGAGDSHFPNLNDHQFWRFFLSISFSFFLGIIFLLTSIYVRRKFIQNLFFKK